MLKKLKILFIDLDGTTLDDKRNGQWTISQTNKQAIIKARKRGVEVVVSTGRIGWTAGQVLNDIGGNYFIQGNGSLITNQTHKIIFEQTMSAATVMKVMNFARIHKLIVRLSFDNKLYGVSSFIKKTISKRFGTEFTSSYNYDMSSKRHKILIFGPAVKWKTQRIGRALEKQFPDLNIATTGKGYGIEITAKNASKGHAASFIAKQLGVRKQQTAHIGDEMNDAAAKNHVGTLIAMKNANKKLKIIADDIAPNHRRGGLARFLETNKYFS